MDDSRCLYPGVDMRSESMRRVRVCCNESLERACYFPYSFMSLILLFFSFSFFVMSLSHDYLYTQAIRICLKK